MSRVKKDVIDFPANPFVALSDFVVVLLIILILALLHQSISSSRMIERMAVADLQQRLQAECTSSNKEIAADPVLRKAYQEGLIEQTYIDGDLQRFWFSGELFYEPGSARIKSQQAEQILTAFGKVLARHQGNPKYPGSGLYKRIIVEGHGDVSEGSGSEVWSLSLQRASHAVYLLQAKAGVSPRLLEASGRGSWFPSSKKIAGNIISGTSINSRIELVIIYSGQRAMDFLQNEPNKELIQDK